MKIKSYNWQSIIQISVTLLTAFINFFFFLHLNSECKTRQEVNKYLKKQYKTKSIQTNFDVRYLDYNHRKIKHKLT